MDISNYIRAIPDFPKKGILFRDITPLLLDPPAFVFTCKEIEKIVKNTHANKIVAIESRGFIFGAPVAANLSIPFIPVRKPGKLPFRSHSIEYALEYGSGILEMHEDAIHQEDKIFVIDDLLATGGTAHAAAQLVTKGGAEVVGFGFVIELSELKGRSLLGASKVHSLIQY